MNQGADEVLGRYGIGPERLLAHAGESSVYWLDDERVLRIIKSDVEYYLRRDGFCGELSALGLPFAVPRLLDHGRVGEVAYAVEARIRGRSLDRMLPELHGRRRERALVAFADAALVLGTIVIKRPWWGELLNEPAIRSNSWPDYLLARASLQFDRALDRLRRDVPGIDRVYDAFRVQALALPEVQPGLAHGDFFPGNVMIDDDLMITGVLDFGFSTVTGDSRMDLVGASSFLEVDLPWRIEADARLVREYLAGRSPGLANVLSLYRTYYAIYFAFTYEFGLSLYDWCVRTLRNQE